ncbi:MAG: hypothetical protein JNL96_12120 [Planctomycetaceae bacterium]|nr:hypothetical protein [Planctomycetaceae bacterium]
MMTYAIIEVDDGFDIIELRAGERAADIAAARNGTLYGTEMFESYDDAYEAILELEADVDEHVS